MVRQRTVGERRHSSRRTDWLGAGEVEERVGWRQSGAAGSTECQSGLLCERNALVQCVRSQRQVRWLSAQLAVANLSKLDTRSVSRVAAAAAAAALQSTTAELSDE